MAYSVWYRATSNLFKRCIVCGKDITGDTVYLFARKSFALITFAVMALMS